MLQKLSQTGEFDSCQRYERSLNGQIRKDHDAATERAEQELTRRLEVHRWRMRLEYKGLVTKCERIRSEHRGQWSVARLESTSCSWDVPLLTCTIDCIIAGRMASISSCSRRRIRLRTCEVCEATSRHAAPSRHAVPSSQ